MEFDIAPTSANPIYRQIVEQVQRLVASGQLAAGVDMPSVRAVALQHAINPMTVSKAYSLLESQGLLERRRGVGMVVAAQAASHTDEPDAKGLTRALLQPALAAAAQAARQLGMDDPAAMAAFAQALAQLPRKPTDDSL